MAIALDYTNRIDPAALKAAGVSDVCRYLSWLYQWGGVTHDYPNPKIIQQREYDELIREGIGVTLNWEYDSRDWMGGAAAGKAHASEAVKQAKALGHPAGKAIIGSADFDMTRAQWDAYGKAYALAFEAGVRAGGFQAGVYGPYDVLVWCADETPIRVFWQCMSTSFSQWRNAQPWPGAHLRQRDYLTVGGVQADYSDILLPDWGQHGKTTAAVRQQPEDDDMAPINLRPGELVVIHPPTQNGGIVDMALSTAFGDADVRIARGKVDRPGGMWLGWDDGGTGELPMRLHDYDRHQWTALDGTDDKVTIQHLGLAGDKAAGGVVAVSFGPVHGA